MAKRLRLAALMVLAVSILAFAQSEGVPAHHTSPPAKGEKLPPIVPKELRSGPTYSAKYQQVGYDLAAKIPDVLHQLPCYCHCDRIGHKSLRTCFESDHAAHCGTCLQEAYYAYFETKKGKTAKQIREGVIRGDFKTINLDQAAEQASKM